jgi:hypothetical protein
MDPRSETLLKEYNKSVEKLARGIYLQIIAIRRDIDLSAINPEDKYAIVLNSIHLLTKPVTTEMLSQSMNQK